MQSKLSDMLFVKNEQYPYIRFYKIFPFNKIKVVLISMTSNFSAFVVINFFV